eukprot:gene7714-11845_t
MSAVNDVLTAVPAAPAQADLLATRYLKHLTRELRILQSEPRDPSAPLPPAASRFELADKLFEGRHGVCTAAHVPPPASATKRPLVVYRLTRAAVASLTAASPSEMSAVNDVLTAVPAAPAQADLLTMGYPPASAFKEYVSASAGAGPDPD